MELLDRRDAENWRAGRIAYLERVIKCNLAKASRILRILHFHAHDLKLKPSMTVYRRKTASGKFLLRFSKSGEKNIEEAYARYFVKLGKSNGRDAFDAGHDSTRPRKVNCEVLVSGSDVSAKVTPKDR